MRKTSVYIETIGCQMNVADTERAASRLRIAGYELVGDSESADVVLFNTCSVRARAEQKVFNRIGEVRKSSRHGKQIVGVTGCVAQLEGAAVFDHAPGVSLVVGTRATDRLPKIIERIRRGERRILDLGERDEGETWDVSPAERHSPHVAFVPIIEGCNKFCTYCIVPYSRGRERSRVASEVVAEVQRLLRSGFKEVHLIGQNVNSYRPETETGLEGFNGATPFSRLLRAVAATGVPRIKFTTSFPRDFHQDIIAAIDECGNLCNWVHLPAQSGSDRVLRLMRRGHKASDYMRRVEAIKNARRKISLTTDIIIGFPGETEKDFQATVQLVKQCQYDGIYIFKYSERKGTPAAALLGKLSDSEKTARFQALHGVQQGIQSEIYASYIGKSVSVLVEAVSTRSIEDVTGHTTCNKVVNFKGVADLIGQIVHVNVTTAKQHSLYGALV